MEKYGVDQSQVDELVKEGMDESSARTAVAKGDGERMVKEARAKRRKALTEVGGPAPTGALAVDATEE